MIALQICMAGLLVSAVTAKERPTQRFDARSVAWAEGSDDGADEPLALGRGHGIGSRILHLPILYTRPGRVGQAQNYLPLVYGSGAEKVPSSRIRVRAPADIRRGTWQLAIGTNQKTGVRPKGLRVMSNAPWSVWVTDGDARTRGRMREFDGRSYGALQLADPLHVVAERDVNLSTGGVLQTGGPNEQGGWQDFDVTFVQHVHFSDRALERNWYRIVVTFSGRTDF